LKILHCVDHYMPEIMAGTEVYIHTLASLQKLSGHEALVLIPHFEYYRPGRFQGHYHYDGMDVYEYYEPSEPLNRDILSGAEQPAGLANFAAFLQIHQPDVVHFHELTRNIGFGVAHVKAAKHFGGKVILTMHLSTYTCNTNTLIRNNELCNGEIKEFQCSECSIKTRLKLPGLLAYPTVLASGLSDALGMTRKLPPGKLKTLLSFPLAIRRIKNELQELVANTDRLVCLTEWYKKVLIGNGVPIEKITVIPQGLAGGGPRIPRAYDGSAGAGVPPLKVAFIGRIQPEKGVDLLIDAAKGFSTGELIVDLYGKEEDSAFYRRSMDDLSKVDTVRYRGQLDRGVVVDKLSGYDIVCLPSTVSEMASLVIQEAFAAGIPVLASRGHGNIEQISDGYNGLLFDFKSSEDLRKKLEILMKTPGLLQKLKGNVRPPKSFETISSAYMELYTQKESVIS
jgi:glycosyltransferase involved in cell wall biosynthesis